MKVLPIDEIMVDNALDSKFSDFEDSLQYFSAKGKEIPIVLTRNTRDYKEQDIIIQTAEEYLKINQNSLIEEDNRNRN